MTLPKKKQHQAKNELDELNIVACEASMDSVIMILQLTPQIFYQ